MAAPTPQPSEYEILREVEALRDLRRRSTTQVLMNDPDLPNQALSSPAAAYWSAAPLASSSSLPDTESSSSSHNGSSSSIQGAFDSDSPSPSPNSTPNTPADDPFRYFWVPASLHPQIDSQKFLEFLEHSKAAIDGNGEGDLVRSSSSMTTSSLGRRTSMLSRQYRPRENDGVEDESVSPLRRNRSSHYLDPQITISDLQKCGDDPEKLRSALKRSFSRAGPPAADENLDDIPEGNDEADAPIIVPPPGLILRRTARTKIRKAGLPGDGEGHRFGSTRRGAASLSRKESTQETRLSQEFSVSDHGEPDLVAPPLRRHTLSDEGPGQRPDSFSEESLIYEWYARASDDEAEPTAPIITTSPPPENATIDTSLVSTTDSVSPEPQPIHVETLLPVLHQPQPQRLIVSTEPKGKTLRSPSPSEIVYKLSDSSSLLDTPSQPSLTSIPNPVSPPLTRKEKEKEKARSLFKWGSGDKNSKKNGKDKERENRERAAEKEKESSFFGSLFGKKKQDSEYTSLSGGSVGREAAQALLGASKSSKSYVPSTSPGLAPGMGLNPYARYPIHVERAIYRLSHIKLANPRRALYEQVLISNLMFWYLGVINKAQNPTAPAIQNGGPPVTAPVVNAQAQKEGQEIEAREQHMKAAEEERQERERQEREKKGGRRGSLTKNSAGSSPGRRAEMPIKGPQYEMQHRVMEQEYGYSGQGPPQPSSRPPSSSDSPNGSGNESYPRAQTLTSQYSGGPPKLVQPQAQQAISMDSYYFAESQLRLPPGAMPPVLNKSSTMVMPRKQTSPSPPPRSRRSQSPQGYNPQHSAAGYESQISRENVPVGHRLTGRSLSATALPSGTPHINGRPRKGQSAHAVLHNNKRARTIDPRQTSNGHEEEDMPLAVYQQQHRK